MPTLGPYLVSLLLAPYSILATAQDGRPPPGERYAEETEVTAVDVVAELPPSGPLRWLAGNRSTLPEDLVAIAEGKPLPVIAVEKPAPHLGRLVLYFDFSLSDAYQVEWAAALLAERAADLVALGEVEIVVADPEALTVLPPSRDMESVVEALSRLAFFGEPRDALVELRMGRRNDDERNSLGPDRESGEGRLSGREAQTIQRSLDELLLTLVDRSEEAAPPVESRRAAVLVSGGFDLQAAASSRPQEPGLEPFVRHAGRTLAAYGWRVIPLLAPEAGGPTPGLRLGNWRLKGGPLPGAVYEEDRDPELAEAHLERARALQRDDRLSQAAEAAQAAVHHFADDPRTRERQAEALLLLAELYEGLGDPQRARRAFRRASRYDPELLTDHPWAAALPQVPSIGLAALTAVGGGTVVRGTLDLSEALDALGRRAVVTVQMPGPADGTLRRIEIRSRTARNRPLAEAWVRFGTPPLVEEARRRW